MQEETKTPFPQFIDPHPRKHFHWAMFLIVVLAFAAALLIVIENFKTAEEIDSMAPVNLKTQTKEDFSDWKTYRNEEYGFELTLTDAWKGYKVNYDGGSITFRVPSEYSYTNDNYSDILFLAIWSPEMYEEEEKQTEGPKWDFLGQQGDNVVVNFGAGQDPPKDISKYEIKKVLSSFKFIK